MSSTSKQEAVIRLARAFNADPTTSVFRIGLDYAVDAIIQAAKEEAKADYSEQISVIVQTLKVVTDSLQQQHNALKANTLDVFAHQGRVLQKIVDTMEEQLMPKAAVPSIVETVKRHPDIMTEDDMKDYYLGPGWRLSIKKAEPEGGTEQ